MSGLTAEEKKLLGAVDEREVIDYCKRLIEIPRVYSARNAASQNR